MVRSRLELYIICFDVFATHIFYSSVIILTNRCQRMIITILKYMLLFYIIIYKTVEIKMKFIELKT